MKKRFISLLTSAVVAASMMFAGTVATFADVEAPAVEETTPVVQEVTDEEQAEAEAVVEDEAAEAPAANEALEGDTELKLMGEAEEDEWYPELSTIYGSGTLSEETYEYIDMNGVSDIYPMFVLNVPDCEEKVTLNLSKDCLVYNYDGKGNFLNGWVTDATKGVKSVTVDIDSNNDGKGDYIQIQNPYRVDENDDWGGGELLYAVKLVPVSTTASVGKFTKSNEKYSYLGFGASQENQYTVMNLTVPQGTEEVTLDFNSECLVYNYNGEGGFLAGWVADATKGTKSIKVKTDYNNDGEGDYIQIQNPYRVDEGNNWVGGELLYVVKMVYATPTFKSATLEKTAYTYNGEVKSPAVTVKNDEGTTLVKGTDYTVAYKNNKTVGKGSVVISGKGDYTFTKTLTFKINPKATKLKKVKRAGKGKMKVTWKKQTTSKTPFTGYQVRYSKKSSMADAKYKTVSKKAVTSKKIKTGKGKFYVQVRTYKVVDGERYYSSWSAKKSVKVK